MTYGLDELAVQMAPPWQGIVGEVAELLVPGFYAFWQRLLFDGPGPHPLKSILHLFDDGSFNADIGVAKILHAVLDAHAAGVADLAIDDECAAMVAEEPRAEIRHFVICRNDGFPKGEFDIFCL